MKLPGWVSTVYERLNPQTPHEQEDHRAAMEAFREATIQEVRTSRKAVEAIEKLLDEMRDRRDVDGSV